MFDRSQPYGEVYGHDHAKYYQNGLHYTGDGTLIGKDPNLPQEKWPKTIKAAEKAKEPDPAEAAFQGRLAAIMQKSAQAVFEGAVKLSAALPELKFEPLKPNVGNANEQAEAKRANAEFIARNSQ